MKLVDLTSGSSATSPAFINHCHHIISQVYETSKYQKSIHSVRYLILVSLHESTSSLSTPKKLLYIKMKLSRPPTPPNPISPFAIKNQTQARCSTRHRPGEEHTDRLSTATIPVNHNPGLTPRRIYAITHSSPPAPKRAM